MAWRFTKVNLTYWLISTQAPADHRPRTVLRGARLRAGGPVALLVGARPRPITYIRYQRKREIHKRRASRESPHLANAPLAPGESWEIDATRTRYTTPLSAKQGELDALSPPLTSASQIVSRFAQIEGWTKFESLSPRAHRVGAVGRGSELSAHIKVNSVKPPSAF